MSKTDEKITGLKPNDYNLNQFVIEASYIFPKKDSMLYLKGGKYYGISWEETLEVSRLFCLGLMSLGIENGDKVGIISHSRYEWRLCDYGILLAAACTVTLYPSLTPAQIAYIVNDSGTKILFVENSRLLRRVLAAKENCPSLTHIIVIAPMKENENPENIISLDDLIKEGQTYYDGLVKPSRDKFLKKLVVNRDKALKKIAKSFDKKEIQSLLIKLSVLDAKIGSLRNDPFVIRYHSIKPDDLASIVYTSGTTGVPKGAMISHKNFYSNVNNTLKVVPISSDDKSLAFLPLSHSLGRMTDHLLMTKVGATVAFAKNTDTIIENLDQVKPTYMTAVPRIFEKVWDKLIAKIEDEEKEEIFWKAVDWGHKYQTAQMEGEELTFMEKVKNTLADKLIFDKIKERLGGRIKFMFSGGAALSTQIARFFQAAEIRILEGYGLTETSPVLTVNTLGKVKIGTVGTPIPDTEIKIAADGEIIAKGPQVFKGYINKPDETAACFNEEGYFLTGDLGSIDEEGFLKITGRKKTLIVLRTGKKVSPVMVEEAIKASRFIEQVCLLGDDQKFITAIIVPNFDFIGEWVDEQGLMKVEEEELVVDNSTTREQYAEILEKRKRILEFKEIQGFIENIIVESQKELSDFEKARKFIIVPDDWNEYNELLTPSLKMKRPNIIKNYFPKIKEMYGEAWME
jgi:long-chain acyl-CoA synthetase